MMMIYYGFDCTIIITHMQAMVLYQYHFFTNSPWEKSPSNSMIPSGSKIAADRLREPSSGKDSESRMKQLKHWDTLCSIHICILITYVYYVYVYMFICFCRGHWYQTHGTYIYIYMCQQAFHFAWSWVHWLLMGSWLSHSRWKWPGQWTRISVCMDAFGLNIMSPCLLKVVLGMVSNSKDFYRVFQVQTTKAIHPDQIGPI